MDNDETAQAEQAPITSKNEIPLRRANIKRVQNVLLIWFDNNMEDNSANYRNTMTQLHRVVNAVNMFTDGKQCIECISSMNGHKVCMIISGSHGQHIVAMNNAMNNGPKIGPIYDSLKQGVRQYEQSSIAIIFMVASDDISNKNLDQLNCSFVYTQIMKGILLFITFEPSRIQKFIT